MRLHTLDREERVAHADPVGRSSAGLAHVTRLSSSLLVTLALSCSATAPVHPVEETSAEPAVARARVAPAAHDKPYWRAIKASQYAVPAGESPLALILELSQYLGSPDPEMRDAFAYEIPADWIHRQHLFSPDDLRTLMRAWMGSLRKRIGERGTDSVLLRSFSALDLSLIAASDVEAPFLGPEEFEELLEAALAYLSDEKDVRGYVPGKGWHHSVAHTADWLKFIARNPQLAPAEQVRVLNAIADKLFAPETGVLTHGEDEGLARVVLSLVRRPEYDAQAFEAWLGRFTAEAKPLWQTPVLDVARFEAVQNGKNLLKSLTVDLSQPGAAATQSTRDARAQVLRCLQGM